MVILTNKKFREIVRKQNETISELKGRVRKLENLTEEIIPKFEKKCDDLAELVKNAIEDGNTPLTAQQLLAEWFLGKEGKDSGK